MFLPKPLYTVGQIAQLLNAFEQTKPADRHGQRADLEPEEDAFLDSGLVSYRRLGRGPVGPRSGPARQAV